MTIVNTAYKTAQIHVCDESVSVVSMSSCGHTQVDEMTCPQSVTSSKSDIDTGTSSLASVCNILATAVGVGMLALPNAIARAGYIAGFGMFAICVGIALMCCNLLQKAMWSAIDFNNRNPANKPVKTYEDIGMVAFGRIGKISVSLALHSALVGCSCLIALLMGKAFFRLVPSVPQWGWIIISCTVMLPFVWLRTMKHIGFVSATLGTASIVALTITVIVSGFMYIGLEGPATWLSSSPTRSYDPWMVSVWGLGTAFGTLTFAFAVTCTLPTILGDMQNKADASRVILGGVTSTSIVYGAVGVCGYLGFGSLLVAPGVEDIFSVLEPQTVLSTILDVLVLLVCVTHYTVMINPSCRALESFVSVHFATKCSDNVCSIIVRTLLVVFTALIAIFCGKFTALVDLIGSISFALVHMVFPPMLYLQMRRKSGLAIFKTRDQQITTIFCGILIVLACVGGTIGSVASITQFIQ